MAKSEGAALPLEDIQGLVLRGYNMRRVRHFVVEVGQAAAARAALGRFVNGADDQLQITTARPWTGAKPDEALNVGISYPAMLALEIGEFSFARSQSVYMQGAADPERAAYVGDVGESAPEHWIAELGAGGALVVFSLFAMTDEALEAQSARLEATLVADGAFRIIQALDGAALGDNRIHFGYVDGLSQPQVEGGPARRLADRQPEVPAWNFVLQNDDSATYYPPTPDLLGLNGSFAAFRVAAQDVAGFEGFLDANEALIDRELLAAKMCGRWRNGVPLALSPDDGATAIAPDDVNNFDYVRSTRNPDGFDDSRGVRCPIGSHARRINPRGQRVAGGGNHRHRVIRRGLPYGPPYDPSQPDDGIERGLLGMFICADLGSQFEFLMHNWINEGGFAADLPPDNQDPMVGEQAGGSREFNIPREGQPTLTLGGLERFVKTRGAAYLFLPSVSALRHIAGRSSNAAGLSPRAASPLEPGD